MKEFPRLDTGLCRERQSRLLFHLKSRGLEGALFFHPFYIHCLTGFWHEQPLTPAALWLNASGKAQVVTHLDPDPLAAVDEWTAYEPNALFTLKENLPGEVAGRLAFGGADRIGVDQATPAAMVRGPACHDITRDFQYLRRRKDADETEALRFSILCAEAAYGEAGRLIKPRITEVEVMAAMLKTATERAGEALSGFGQDFRCGAPGGSARSRPIEEGEIFVLDVGVGVRGYRSDLCRSFAVSGAASPAQRDAHGKILELFPLGEGWLRPGRSCREMFAAVAGELDGWRGYAFFHHAGHGIGLDPHEVPRINPHWNDTFEPGDVVAFEPGLYGEELRGGIRLEENYRITESEPEKLSSYPLDL